MIRKKFGKREIGIGILSALAVISILTFYIWHQMESIRIGYEIRDLEERLAALKEEVKALQAKKSFLLSLKRIEKIATKELKLASPKEEQLVYDDFIPFP
ncbi:MAG: cell division protein FtsL [Candidatus Aminicenantaceae bacterium]